MDIQRSILILALTILTYLIILQWNRDYENESHSTNNIKNHSDVPFPRKLNENDNILTYPDRGSAELNRLIHVQTDVLKVTIDLHGGDIVKLGLLKYLQNVNSKDLFFQLLDNGTERLYLAQSGLTGINGPDASISGRPIYYSKNNYYEISNNKNELIVDIHYKKNNIKYIKRFTFYRGVNLTCSEKEKIHKQNECINTKAYQILVTYIIDNSSKYRWNGNLFAQLKRDSSPDPSATTATGLSTYLGAAIWTPETQYEKISIKNIEKQPLNKRFKGGWIAWLQHYFVTAWVPNPEEFHRLTTRKDIKGNYIIGLTGPTIRIPPNAKSETSILLYAGPKLQTHLKHVSKGLELTVDYGFLWFIAQPMFWLLQNINKLIGNWGWSIILLTVLIKMLFLPLSAIGYNSMARMRAISPKMQAIKEKYSDNRQKMSYNMMELYKKEKINPIGGCFPILIQMPVFISLYWVILESVEIRHTPWISWITDLSIKDPLFILPIIMGITMFIQQMLNPSPPDPIQAKVMKLMPIIFTFFFLWFPAGLVLYWVVNNILSILQQFYMMKRIK